MKTTTLGNLPDAAALEQALDLRRKIDVLENNLRSMFTTATTRKYTKRKASWRANYWTPARKLAKARAMRKWHREQKGAQ